MQRVESEDVPDLLHGEGGRGQEGGQEGGRVGGWLVSARRESTRATTRGGRPRRGTRCWQRPRPRGSAAGARSPLLVVCARGRARCGLHSPARRTPWLPAQRLPAARAQARADAPPHAGTTVRAPVKRRARGRKCGEGGRCAVCDPPTRPRRTRQVRIACSRPRCTLRPRGAMAAAGFRECPTRRQRGPPYPRSWRRATHLRIRAPPPPLPPQTRRPPPSWCSACAACCRSW